MHTNSRLLFQKHARGFFRPGVRVLEIGPDQFPSTYCSLVADPSITWDTLDIWQDARLTYSATSEYSFPAPSDAYDIVLSGQVIEHVRKIWLWIKELTRVCKVGGLVITINPVSWPYHEHPIDCWRAFPEGMRALYEDASLEYSYQSSSRWRRESTEDTFRAGHRNGSPGCCAMPTKYWVESGFLWSVRMTLLRLARRLSRLTRRSRRLTAQLSGSLRRDSPHHLKITHRPTCLQIHQIGPYLGR